MKPKFYLCPTCGNVIVKLVDSNVVPVCCGHTMQLLTPNTTDAKEESHVPVWERTSPHTVLVSVGEHPHPMTIEHHISFVCLVTCGSLQIRYLLPESKPELLFHTDTDPIALYAYCNRHGLWSCCCQETNCKL